MVNTRKKNGMKEMKIINKMRYNVKWHTHTQTQTFGKIQNDVAIVALSWNAPHYNVIAL